MKDNNKPFALLSRKKVVASSVAAIASLTVTAAASSGPVTTQPNLENGNIQVTVCHKGKDLSVALPALPGHIGHGDSLGSCDEPGGGGRGGL